MTRRRSIGAGGGTAPSPAGMAYRRAAFDVAAAVRHLEVAAADLDGSRAAISEKAELDLVDAHTRLGRLLTSHVDGGPG